MHKSKKENISVLISFLVIIILVIGAVYFIMNKPEKSNPMDGISTTNGEVDTSTIKEKPQGEQLPQKSNMEQNARILENFTPVVKVDSLQKIDLKEGIGDEVKESDTVSVHYTGAIASNGAIFQSSKDFGTNPVTFPLDRVIKGWTDGIPGMKIGGVRRLVIPSSMAYGSNPPEGSGIPADADLVFDVELVAIQ